MRLLCVVFVAVALAGCNRVKEVAAPDQPLVFNYQMCNSDCTKCAGEPQTATLQAQPGRTGSLVLKDVNADGGVERLTVEECHFYSNNDWHCIVKPGGFQMSASVPNLLAHAWFKREIGFKDGEYYTKNADTMPSVAQKLNPEAIQFEACLTRPQ